MLSCSSETRRIQNAAQLLVTLNCRIAALTRSCQHAHALRLFSHLQSFLRLAPDHYSLAGALAACSSLRASAPGEQLHACALRSGLLSFPLVANSLLSFYAKSHGPDSARRLFDTIPSPDVYSCTTLLSAYAKAGQFRNALALFKGMPKRSPAVWNALITGGIEHGHGVLAFDLFFRMHQSGVQHDEYSFASVMGLCNSPDMVGFGRHLHSMVIKTGFIASKVSVVNALITMYLDFGLISCANDLFGEAVIRDEITYNAFIAGLVSWGRNDEALMVFKEMKERPCILPNELTFMTVLSACSSKVIGVQIYAQAIKMGVELCQLVGNAAVTMYSSCRDVASAWKVFDKIREKDTVSWNSLISGYRKANCCASAIMMYCQMRWCGIAPDEFTYGSLLACIGVVENAKTIHAIVTKNGLISSVEVQNSLISTYSKCEEINGAYMVFCEMPIRNLISWNAILSGFMFSGFPLRGLQSFSNMIRSGLEPNSYTLSIVLSTCAAISALKHGRELHGFILRSGSGCETSLGNVLISMYAKCGDLDCSLKVFNGIPQRDLVSWNSIIAALAQNSKEPEALVYFKLMQRSKAVADSVTFTILLSACSHAGLVEEGRLIFSSMVKDHGIEPGVDHCSCIIDLLCRAGHLDEAERLINCIPCRVDPHIWWILLSACSIHPNRRLGRIAASSLMETEPENPAIYVLLSNIEAAIGQWEESSSVREDMRNGVAKMPGCSWTESGCHLNPCSAQGL